MTDFLMESTLCMGILLAVYHLLLQREKLHRFNRFYLLLSMLSSLALPFITIEVYTVVASEPLQETSYLPVGAPAAVIEAKAINYLPYIGWAVYSLVTIALVFRFVSNIIQFVRQIKSHKTVAYDKGLLVLLDEAVLPHTFLNYIFVNRADYENRLIEPELFTHELVHVNQKHTLDILCVEILKTLFWFNPLLYFYKKAIQLNHEFLADEVVVATGNNVTGYQQLLLQKATPATYYQLASSLNFSVTKKRFTMMTKATTKSKALLLKLSALPVIAGLVIFLCVESVAQERKSTKAAQDKGKKNTLTDDQRRDAYYKGVWVSIDNRADNVKINKVYDEFTEEEKDRYMFYAPEIYAIKHPTKEEYENFKNKKGYALQIDGKDVDNAVLNNYKREDFAYYQGYTMAREALTKQNPQIFHYQLYTLPYFEKHLKGTNTVYPGKVFEMTITKQIKDDKVIASEEHPKRVSSWAEAEAYLQQYEIFSSDKLDPQPQFPGGDEKFFQAVRNELRMPSVNEDADAKIVVSFVIEKDGSMSNMIVVKHPGYGLGDEMLRVLKKMNETMKWKPGKLKGKTVRASRTLPITINMKK